MSEVEITINEGLENILKKYRVEYPTLDDEIILKMLISQGDKYNKYIQDRIFNMKE